MRRERHSFIVNDLQPKALVIAIAACLLSVMLALVGAELPPETSFFAAFPLWLTIIGTAAFLLTAADGLLRKIAGDIGFARPAAIALGGVLAVLVVNVPVALMCLPLDTLLPDTDSLFEASTGGRMATMFWVWADQYVNLLPGLAGFWLFIKALDVAMPPATASMAEPEAHPKEQATPSALARRFPQMSGKALLAIEADEHYVRLHTDKGSEHVLYRFRDALKDVDDVAGLRVHRSWWVAEEAMEALVKTGGNVELRLRGSLTVPVSQTYRREVERAMSTRSGAVG